MFGRANDLLGSNWPVHDLRHTASYRLARDPKIPLTDVQWVLAHAYLSTTQLYLPASRDEVIETVRAHHDRQAQDRKRPPAHHQRRAVMTLGPEECDHSTHGGR